MICPRCTVKNPDQAEICSNCGQALKSNPFGTLSGATSLAGAPLATAAPSGTANPMAPATAVNTSEAAGKTPPTASGLGILSVSALIGALLVGVIYHFVGLYMDWIVVTPLLLGLLLGGALRLGVRKGKIRHAATVLGIAVFASCLCYGTKLFTDSVVTREEFITNQVASLPSLLASHHLPPGTITPATFEAHVRKDVPVFMFFVAYLKSVGQIGFSVSSTGASSSSGSQVTGLGAYGLLLLDLVVLGFTAAAIGGSAAMDPYCDPCDRWYDGAKVLLYGHTKQGPAMAQLAQTRDWDSLGAFQGGKYNTKYDSAVVLNTCPGCGMSYLRVRTKTNNSIKYLFRAKLSPDEARQLRAARTAK